MYSHFVCLKSIDNELFISMIKIILFRMIRIKIEYLITSTKIKVKQISVDNYSI